MLSVCLFVSTQVNILLARSNTAKLVKVHGRIDERPEETKVQLESNEVKLERVASTEALVSPDTPRAELQKHTQEVTTPPIQSNHTNTDVISREELLDNSISAHKLSSPLETDVHVDEILSEPPIHVINDKNAEQREPDHASQEEKESSKTIDDGKQQTAKASTKRLKRIS